MDCCKNNSLIIYRGSNNTRFLDCDWLNIKFQTQFDLTNFSAKFKLGIAERTWDTLSEGITINLNEQEIEALSDGINYAQLVVWDSDGNSKPFSTSIPVFVKVWVEGDQKLEEYHMFVDAKFEGETVMTITIESVGITPQQVDDKIEAHNISQTSHQDIRTEVGTKQPKLTSTNAGTDIEITEEGGVVKINSTAEGVTVHNQLTGRDANNAHPISAISGLQEDLDTFYAHIDNKSNPHEVSKEQVGLGNVQNIDTTDASNITSGKLGNDRLNTIPYSKLSGVASSAQGALADSALQESDIINNTTSTATNKALSANMGKSLQDQVDNLNARGKYLSIWDCTTGLAMDEPPVNPYTIETGSYFIVGKVASEGGVNYRPNGGIYDKNVPSRVVETTEVKLNATYYWDGTQWRLVEAQDKDVSFSSLAGSPYDNTNLAGALNSKQATIDDLDTIRSGASAGATALQSGDNVSELTNDAGYITSSYHDTTKQDTLVSGTNIKTINNTTILGSGNISVATSAQGSKADTAIQPNDNVSDLTNDAGYLTLSTLPIYDGEVE